MKLTNQQIEAVISNVREIEETKFEKEYKEKKDKETKAKAPLAKKYYQMYKSLPVELQKHFSPYDRISESSILNSLVKVEKKTFQTKELRNKIILASIDAASLEELKMKLKLSF